MKNYSFTTDAVAGTIKAKSLADAVKKLDKEEGISSCYDAWGFVEDENGERHYIYGPKSEESHDWWCLK